MAAAARHGTIEVSGAESGTFRLSKVRTGPLPAKDGVLLTLSTEGAEVVIEVPAASGDGHLTSVRLTGYFIGDCTIPVVRQGTKATATFTCPGLAAPDDSTRTITVKGDVSADV
ncbi:MAG: hypothetical protein QOK43_1636 [Acidimicrobiaceae bacterium]|nr:hypothetical protein [Acidimicrobiaceae bacterium]